VTARLEVDWQVGTLLVDGVDPCVARGGK